MAGSRDTRSTRDKHTHAIHPSTHGPATSTAAARQDICTGGKLRAHLPHHKIRPGRVTSFPTNLFVLINIHMLVRI